MYNSKRFETVKNMRENKKISNAVQAAIGVLAVVLASLIVWMMVLVSGIQGTARVVNYAGLVRGETQRLVKMEIAGQAEDGMMESVESFINGLRFGDDELTLVRLGDKSFQTKMEELASCFESLKQEIYLVREKGFEKTDIIDKSEKFFDICDEATGLAETYSQKRASSLAVLERYITADIVVLMMLIGYEFIKALHYAAMNHALQKKVYMDEATGLPNKNKCEELLSAPEMITMPVGVCSFDLNNLRRINNSMGHEKGDAYIRIFAELVREAVPAHYFVGRAGGDEFIAIMDGASLLSLNKTQTVFSLMKTALAGTPLAGQYKLLTVLAAVVLIVLLLTLFLRTRMGLAIRATGNNPDMVRSSSINPAMTTTVGLCTAGSFTALSGYLLAQYQKAADINIGQGMVTIALASLLIGSTILGRGGIFLRAVGAVLGAVVFRLVYTVALRLDMPAFMLKLVSAVIVVLAISIPYLRTRLPVLRRRMQRKAG
mgnify:CR=1 FL=1